ncbi:N-acetyltransferase [Aquibium carbonis]|uniref:N-acetyltransferase n=1 Tax=Aquibium carbonis TaxID=2495581 RepID=A0A429Z347_9HYPH|nr:GNAT family N-acetyltransferase [Aquibium carbonis]RST88123.1 N-acetyltransferase [Aquibium carbonis]
MPTEAPVIGFRPVGAADLPMLERWMRQPHWRKWWGDSDEEIRFVQDMIEGRDTTRPFIFTVDGDDAGYIQYWFIGHHQNESWLADNPWLGVLPAGTIGVDLSIGPADRLSKGIGTAALTAFVAMLRATGFSQIIIDPDPANLRAVRAYEKAGFQPIPELLGKSGDSLIMRHVARDTATQTA